MFAAQLCKADLALRAQHGTSHENDAHSRQGERIDRYFRVRARNPSGHHFRVTRAAGQPPDWLRTEARQVYGVDPESYEAGRPEYPLRCPSGGEGSRDWAGDGPGHTSTGALRCRRECRGA
jgi:hypothetical protein